MDDRLPSSVPIISRGEVVGPHDFAEGKIVWIHVYCGSCHVIGPQVPKLMIESGGFCAWFCNDCSPKYSEQIGLSKCPDEVFFAKVAEVLTEEQIQEHEIERHLADPSSVLSKLARERFTK